MKTLVAILLATFAVRASAPGEMHIRKVCAKSACEARQDGETWECHHCIDVCKDSDDPTCGDRCDELCDIAPCDENERTTCTVTRFDVALPKTTLPAIEAACLREAAHFRECGLETGFDTKRCKVFAAVERPDVVGYYEDLANLACDALEDRVASTFAPEQSTLGDEACRKLDDVCGFCDPALRDGLNIEGAWFRDDVLATANFCLQQQRCLEVRECLTAWRHAVTGQVE